MMIIVLSCRIYTRARHLKRHLKRVAVLRATMTTMSTIKRLIRLTQTRSYMMKMERELILIFLRMAEVTDETQT